MMMMMMMCAIFNAGLLMLSDTAYAVCIILVEYYY